MLQRALLPYPIPRRHLRCCRCHESFTPGTLYATWLLLPTHGNAGSRVDLCGACSTAGPPLGANEGAIFWQGKLPSKNEEGPHQALVQRVVALLREISTSQEEIAAEQAFLLALYLARQRQLVLRHEEQAAEGAVMLWYEVVATGELLAVSRTALHPPAAADLQRWLTERLAE